MNVCAAGRQQDICRLARTTDNGTAPVRLWLCANILKGFCVGVGEDRKQVKRINCIWLGKECLKEYN